MDKIYWKKYYELHGTPAKPSLFAQFIFDNYLKKEQSLIDLGCGNGRDSIFFVSHGIKISAVDQCKNEISFLKEKFKMPDIKFICGDFTKLDKMKPFDNVYSRFTLHSISEKGEDAVIEWAYNNLKKNGKLFIEARSKNNELYKLGEPVPGETDAYILDNHYRRFIDTDRLQEKLNKAGFEVIYFEEKNGFGGETDQRFFREIAIKKIK